jgi:lipopolysaccharide transport system ATP-binding protein
VQAGLRVRTVEGVEVYGTSTSYVERSADDVRAGDRVVFRFRFAVNLCVGTYFVSIAAAESLPGGSMVYLDKRADILMIKVRQHPVTSTGIADLNARVEVELARQEPASAG